MHAIHPDRSWPLHGVARTRQLEQLAQAQLAPHVLMQRAGLAVAQLALALAPHARTIWLACGPGNNGGDGMLAALHLQRWGKQAVVTWLGTPESASAALGAYAGGWNPAGLGSPEVLRPEVAATAVVQVLLFGHGALAVSVLILAAFLFGAIGTGRLLRVWGIGPVAGYLAGTVLMAGPAAVALAGDGAWGPLVALGALPWSVAAAIGPWPQQWSRSWPAPTRCTSCGCSRRCGPAG